ncbi:hypothetical protein ACF1DY_27735 [Streptomyces albus]
MDAAAGPQLSTEGRGRARGQAPVPGPPPRWIRALQRGDDDAWQLLHRARRVAFDARTAPGPARVEDLHHEEFTRCALTAAPPRF